MNKMFTATMAALLALTFTPIARADTYRCQLLGEMHGIRVGFIFGGQILGGYGRIDCHAENGPQRADMGIPVQLSLVGGGFAFDLNWVRSVRIVSAGVGHVRDPRDLLGQFSVGPTAGATLIAQGISVNAAISVKNYANGLGFEVGLLGEQAYGIGARLEGVALHVRPLAPPAPPAPLPPPPPVEPPPPPVR